MHLTGEGPGAILSFKTFLSFINRLLVTIYHPDEDQQEGTLSAPFWCLCQKLSLLYTLIKLYYTKAPSDQASSLALDWIRLLQRLRIPASLRDSITTFQYDIKIFLRKNIFVEKPEWGCSQAVALSGQCLSRWASEGPARQGWAQRQGWPEGGLKEPERERDTHRVRSSTGGRRRCKETRKHKQEGERGRWEQSVKGPSNGSRGQSPQLLCMACLQPRSPSRGVSLPTPWSFRKRQHTTASSWISISTKQSFKKETKSSANSDAYARSFLILL